MQESLRQGFAAAFAVLLPRWLAVLLRRMNGGLLRVSQSQFSLTVIIAAHNSEELLPECLNSVLGQLTPGDCVVVVDDGSSDTTASLAARLGAEIISQPKSQGPYNARNAGAARSSTDGLIFFDTRCVARPGWLEGHRTLLSMGPHALSYGEVTVAGGSRLAEELIRELHPFAISNYAHHEYLPYFPTCNLGVRRTAFEAVGGFKPVRSGGDADFCWRVQEAGQGTIGLEPATLVDWRPRKELKQLMEQYWRYGVSTVQLSSSRGADVGLVKRILLSPLRIGKRLLTGAVNHPGRPSLAFGSALIYSCYEAGYLSQAFRKQWGAESN